MRAGQRISRRCDCGAILDIWLCSRWLFHRECGNCLNRRVAPLMHTTWHANPPIRAARNVDSGRERRFCCRDPLQVSQIVLRIPTVPPIDSLAQGLRVRKASGPASSTKGTSLEASTCSVRILPASGGIVPEWYNPRECPAAPLPAGDTKPRSSP
jgi:hypothetical protein